MKNDIDFSRLDLQAEDITGTGTKIEVKMTFDSFHDIVCQCNRQTKTIKEAYEEAENIHEQMCNCRRYSDYPAYRQAKSNNHKKK